MCHGMSFFISVQLLIKELCIITLAAAYQIFAITIRRDVEYWNQRRYDVL